MLLAGFCLLYQPFRTISMIINTLLYAYYQGAYYLTLLLAKAV